MDIGISENLLSEEAQNQLRDLTSLLIELDIESTSSASANLVLAINSVQNQNLELNEKYDAECDLTQYLVNMKENLEKCVKDSENVENKINAHVDPEKASANSLTKAEKIKFNDKKSKQYSDEACYLEQKLLKTEFTEALSLDLISQKIKRLDNLTKEVEEKQEALESYCGLPADIRLTENCLKELRKKYQDIMNELLSDCGNS